MRNILASPWISIDPFLWVRKTLKQRHYFGYVAFDKDKGRWVNSAMNDDGEYMGWYDSKESAMAYIDERLAARGVVLLDMERWERLLVLV
jgi:hypothetical protein